MQSNNLTRYVVDASIAVKWYLHDEEYVHEAEAVLEAFGSDRIALIAPDHIRYEITNAVRNALRTRRVPVPAERQAITNFLDLGIPTVGANALLIAGYDYALRFDCALYDGLYLALADRAQCPFIHADRRLHNTLNGRFARELWIESFT